jgi:hypothetical protein
LDSWSIILVRRIWLRISFCGNGWVFFFDYLPILFIPFPSFFLFFSPLLFLCFIITQLTKKHCTQMDSKGWIPIQLLASFNRVRQLTLDIMLVRDVLLLSSVAQVHHGGDWVRMGGWESFVLPDAKKSGVDDSEAVAVERGQDEGVDQVGGFMKEYVAGESAMTTLAFAQGESEPGERAFAKGEPGRQEGSSRRSAGEGGGVRDSPTDVIEGEALEVSEGNGKGGDLGYEEVEEEVEEEEEEEEEEDVVFVMGEEVQAVAGTWSPERIAS